MDKLWEKNNVLWYYGYYLDLARIIFEIYLKTKDKVFYNDALEWLDVAKRYKNKLSTLSLLK